MPKRPPLSKSELEIAQIVWKLGSAKVRDIVQALPPDRGLDFFTVQTYLRRLKTKGYLRTRREGRADIYSPAVEPARVIHQVTAEFVKRTFGGEPFTLMQHLIADHGLTDREIDQLQAALDEFQTQEQTMISNQLFDAVARQIVQTTILIVAVGALMRFVSRRRPHLAYLFLLLVLVKLLTPPVWSSPTGIFSWSATPPFAAGVPIQSDPNFVVPVQSAAVGPSAPVAISQSASPWRMTGIVMVIWTIGALSMLLAVLIRSSHLRRRLAASAVPAPVYLLDMIESLRHSLDIRRSISLTFSDQPIGPAVFGILRPALVVPNIILENQNHRQLRALLAHEFLHLRRGDTLVAGLQLLAQIIWWFNPLVWLLNSQINQVREMCCDAEAIANTQCPRDDYAQMLVDVLRRRRVLQPMFPSLGVRPAQVTARRLRQVLRGTGWPHRHLPWKYWIAFAFCSLLILPGSKIPFYPGAGTAFADPPPSSSANGPTVPVNQRLTHFVRVVVDVDSVTFQGKPTTLNELPTLLETIPDRTNTVLSRSANCFI